MTEYQLYRKEVWKHTNNNDLTLLENNEKRARAGVDGGYHLDHKYSISAGYLNGIDPCVIGSLKNLQFIPWKSNVCKQGNCSITIEGF